MEKDKLKKYLYNDRIDIKVSPIQIENLIKLEESFIDTMQMMGANADHDKELRKLLQEKYNKWLKEREITVNNDKKWASYYIY